MVSATNLTISEKMRIDVCRRSPAASWAFIALATLIYFFPFGSQLFRSQFKLISLTLIAISLVRIFVARRYLLKASSFLYRVNGSLAFLNGAIWGLLVSLVFAEFPLGSSQVVLAAMIAVGISGSSTSSLVMDPWLQLPTISIISLLPLTSLVYLISKGTHPTEGLVLAGFIFINALYVLAQSKKFYQQMLKILKYEHSLENDRRHLESVVNSLPGFVVCLDRDLRFSAVSDSVVTQLGLNLVRGENVTHYQDAVSETLASFALSPYDHRQVELPFSDGRKTSWYLLSMIKTSSEKVAIVASASLVDELKKTRQELDLQKRKAEAASRVASLSAMASEVAAEINLPVQGLASDIENLNRFALELAEPHRSQLFSETRKAIHEVKEIGYVVEGLKSLSIHEEKPDLEICDLRMLLDDAFKLSQSKLKGHGIRFRIEQKNKARISCKPYQLSKIFFNLINQISNTLSDVKEATIKVTLEERNLSVQVRFTSNAPYTDAKDWKECFFGSTLQTSSINLNYEMTKAIIEDHDGEIHCEEEDSRVILVISFPLIQL